MPDRRPHPYLAGNYAPIHTAYTSKPCQVEGHIPDEFLGGQYVRNGSNPANDVHDRDLHWFDGDGMLTGVFFKRGTGPLRVQPLFDNRYVLTDVHLATRKHPSFDPIVPSMATLINPEPSRWQILRGVMRTGAIVVASLCRLTARPIRRVGPANTSILHYDGRVLATNETGPPMRVLLPSLETIGWYTGYIAEGELKTVDRSAPHFGGNGLEGFYKEWTTAHPRVDPTNEELILFHSTFLPPYVLYSIVPAGVPANGIPRLNLAVPGLSSGKLMHDFGVSLRHTVILDCPVYLNPYNLAKGKAAVGYDRNGQTRVGVFPRYAPDRVQWYKTDPCIVMHTANTWDEETASGTNVHILLCRLNSIAPVYHMGGMAAPESLCPPEPECRLYYYQISNRITQQWALSSIPFEFPHVPRHLEMTTARYIYGCSMRQGNFASTVMSSVKIDCLVKVDVRRLIAMGEANPPAPIHGAVDERSIQEIINSKDPKDPIRVFTLPDGWYAQECSWVSRDQPESEDDGWLVTYVFDESQLDENGEAPDNCKGELWIIEAREMKEVVAKVILPQRVPYGMHGSWFSEQQILSQRGYTKLRTE